MRADVERPSPSLLPLLASSLMSLLSPVELGRKLGLSQDGHPAKEASASVCGELGEQTGHVLQVSRSSSLLRPFASSFVLPCPPRPPPFGTDQLWDTTLSAEDQVAYREEFNSLYLPSLVRSATLPLSIPFGAMVLGLAAWAARDISRFVRERPELSITLARHLAFSVVCSRRSSRTQRCATLFSPLTCPPSFCSQPRTSTPSTVLLLF